MVDDTVDWIQRFLRRKKNRNTRASYEHVLTKLEGWCRSERLGLSDVTSELAEGWLDKLTYVCGSTRRLFYTVLGCFFRFLADCGELQRNPMIAVPPPDIEPPQRRHLEAKEIEELLRSARREGPFTDVIVNTLFYSGIRASEAANLALDDVTRDKQLIRIHVRRGKGGKSRTILVNEKLSKMLFIWCRRMKARGHNHVFPSPKNGTVAIGRSTVWAHVKRAAKGASIPSVSPHWLRHAFASRSLDLGAPLQVVRQDLGHSSLQTTSRYISAQSGSSSSSFL